MGTREWMLSTFMGCCLWILHGLGTTTAVPVTTEGPFAATPSQSEAPTALLLGTMGTRTVSDTVTAESILVSATVSPSFPSWAEPDSVTETTGYNSSLGAERDAELSTGEVTQAPTEVPQVGTDVATSLDATQKNQSGLAAATAAAIVVTPQPNFTPSTKHNVTGTTAAAPSGSTPIFADVPASTTRAGGGLESTTDAMFLPSVTIPTAAGTQALTTTPLHPGVTALPPAAGAEVEGVTLPGDSIGDGRALSSISSPGATGFLPTPWTKVVSGTVGDTPGWAALESGDLGDAANGVFSTADTSQLPPESVAALETAENPGQSSLLTDQAGPSPANLLGPGDGDKQGAPTLLLSGPGSALSDSEAPAAPGVRGDTATLLPGTEVQSDADVPDAGTGVPLSTEAVNLAKSSQQPAPWLSPTREAQSLLGADPPAPTGTSGAPSTAFPPPGVAAGSLLQTNDGTEAVVSPDYGADLGVSLSPFLEESQPWGTATDRPSTSLNSALGATNPSSSAPDGTTLPAAGQQAEGSTGAGGTTQAEDAGDGSPYANILSDTSPAASSIQQGPTDNTPGAVPHTELSPAPAAGEGALAPALSPSGPTAPGHDLSGAGGSGPLPIEALGAPGAALPPAAAVDGAVFEANNGAEAAVSPDLGAAPGEPASSSLDVLQPWDTAAGAPVDTALPGAEGPDTGINSALNTPSSASSGPVGPPSPDIGAQPGTGLTALGGVSSAAAFEPSLSSSPVAGLATGTGLLPGTESSPNSASHSGILAIPSISDSDGAAAPIPAAAPGSTVPSQVSAYGPELTVAQGINSAGGIAQAEIPESQNPYTDTSPAASSIQQGPTDNTPGAVLHTELSPAPAPGEGELEPALSPNSPAAPSHDLFGDGGSGPLPIEALGAPGAALPPAAAVDGAVFEANNGAEAAVSPDLGAAPEAPVSPSLSASQPWDTAAGAPVDTALPGAEGPDTGINSALNTPSSASYGPVGPPSPSFGIQPGTGLGMPAVDGPDTSLSSALGATNPSSSAPDGTTLPAAGQQAEGNTGAGDTTQAEDAGDGSPYANIQSDTSPAASSIQQGPTDNTPGAVPHTELSPAPAAGEGALAPALSPSGPTAPGHDHSGAGGSGPLPIEALGAPGAALPPAAAVDGAVFEANNGAEAAVSPDLGAAPGEPASSSLDVLQPWDTAAGAPVDTTLPGAEGPDTGINSALNTPSSASSGPVGPPSPDIGAQPGTGLTALGGVSSAAAFEPSLSSSPVAGLATGTGLPGTGAEAAVSPDLGAAPEAPVSPSLSASQPWDTAVGAPEDTALPGAEGPSSGFSSVLAAPSSASYGPEGPPSPGIGAQPGTGLTALGAEGQVLGGVSSAAIFEPSPSSSPGTGLKAGTDLLPAALSPSGPASPSDALTAPSASDTAGPSVLGGAGGAPSALQPSLVAAPGLHSAAGGVRDGAEAVSADREAPGQSQDQTGTGAAVASSGRQGSTLISISSSPSADGSSLPQAAAGADTGAGIPRAGGAGSSSGSGAAALQSNKEIPILPPTIQSNANVGPPDAKLSQVNVVEPAGGKLEASAQGSPPASGGNALGTVIQITSGVSSPSIPTSPQETQPLVPVAPAASSPLMVAASASARGVGGISVPNAGPASASSAQSGSSPPAVPQPPVDEMASGMLAPLGEELQPAPNAAPALPSASERENLKEGAATSPQLSSLISATPGQPAATPTPPPLPPVPAVPLYRYGVRENDHEYVQRRVDFNSPLFKPEIGFPFGKTLRDSLYFTDNGQIIFPASDSSIFTLPSPPARGFTGHESVPMIAVFWDNADFSRGTGTTFYQEFLTLNSEKPPFIRDVEAKVRHYLRSSYSAAWTLKITWEKAPAYGARGDSRRTNTYQAVLTTDGFRSYVLILYKDGGMQWDYTQLPATNVLIGYTSGDGHYRNDDLTQGSPAAKYRPDRYRGYNTDLRGLWLYKLESRVGINYRLKCLAWTGQQQEPQEWSHDLPACPCSLQQGQQDRRFRSGHGGWGSARVSMLHSASPNSHGAGVRCLYDGRGQLVEGRQERYWRAYRQASPYRDQELKLYDWCCNQAGSARLCARYNEKRPRIGCEDSSEDSDSKEQRDEEEE